MEWKGYEGNDPVCAWSFNPVSTRRKPHWASHIQSRNWVHTGIVRILYILESYIYAWYKSHDDATLSYMEDALCRFHTFKDGVLPGQAGSKAKAKANTLRRELVNKWKVDEETNAESWMPCKRRRETNAWRDYICHGINVSKQLDADFSCLKIHFMFHSVEQIRRYGALQ